MNNNFPIIEFDYRLGHRAAFARRAVNHTKTNISSLCAYLPTPHRSTHKTESMFHYRRSRAPSCATRMNARTTKGTDTFWRAFELRFTCEYKFMNNLRSRHDPQIHQIDVNMHSLALPRARSPARNRRGSAPGALGSEDSRARQSLTGERLCLRARALFACSRRQRSSFSQRSIHSRAPLQVEMIKCDYLQRHARLRRRRRR